MKWVTLGDASAKFFHANATVKYRRNLITQLVDEQGQQLINHNDKAALIWESFKERLGTTNFTGLQIDLPTLLDNSVDLSSLITTFTNDEIGAVVRNLPLDKAPGPDGFNTNF